MLFRQLMDWETHRFTYLVASRFGGEAVLIDPVSSQRALYVRLLQALDLRLVCALGTSGTPEVSHGLTELQAYTGCVLAMGRESRVACVDRRLSDGEVLDLEGLKLEALHTPGFAEDSYSFVMDDRVFTGDTLLVDDTGPTDRPGGNARQQYDSLFSKLLCLPACTVVYPAHGSISSHATTIAEQRLSNPKLQVKSVDEFVDNCRRAPPRSEVAPRVNAPKALALGSQQSTCTSNTVSAAGDEVAADTDPSLQQIA